MNKLIYGKDDTERIVAIETKNDQVWLFLNDGEIIKRDYTNWLLTDRPLPTSIQLDGDLHFKFLTEYDSRAKFFDLVNIINQRKMDRYSIYNSAEAAMVRHGYTLFKGLKVQDISVLATDIETNGVTLDDSSQVVLIANTYRDREGNITKRLFDINEYDNQQEMIDHWCGWVRVIDPDVLCGHNFFGFDLPYLDHCSENGLQIGRDFSFMHIEDYTRQKRKDGSQSYDYNDCKIFGRQIIDTMFLAFDYDFSRKYKSYGLKQIIEQEGLEKEDRVKWDFDKNPVDIAMKNAELWEQFKQYAKDDGDDALALFDLMIPSFFYYAQSVPMSLQSIVNTATGRQINQFLIRSYVQDGHSIPKKSEAVKYEGAISFGNPGIYTHVCKVDVASLYPSIIIADELYNKEKDPKAHFLKMVQYFTDERLSNKQKGKITGDRYYKDLEQSQKIVINSAYGMMGASGLNFNSPPDAAHITERGREILQRGIDWSDARNYQLVNVDTDSFSYSKGRQVTSREFAEDIESINAECEPQIRWEDDGQFDRVLVVKSKNYILRDYDGKITTKGSAFKDAKKEEKMRELLRSLTDSIIKNGEVNREQLKEIYNWYVNDIFCSTNAEGWASKKTITKAVLFNDRTTERKIRDALGDKHVQEGDKIFVYPAIDGMKTEYTPSGKEKLVPNRVLKLVEDFNDDLDTKHLLKRLYDTTKILSNVVDSDIFINYSLKRHENDLIILRQQQLMGY